MEWTPLSLSLSLFSWDGMGGEGGQWNGHVSHSSHFAEMGGGVVIAKKKGSEKSTLQDR